MSVPFSDSAPGVRRLPYAQASVAQRVQLLAFLRLRLSHHFPSLSPAAWWRALFEFQPTLILGNPDSVTLDQAELTQLVQHLGSSPDLPLLDPPLYGLPALDLAQHWLHGGELAAAALSELAPGSSGPQLLALLTYLLQPYPLAERVVQAWRWDLASSPPLPSGLPGNKLTPGSLAAIHYLTQLRQSST